MYIDINTLIGKSVIYYDFCECRHFGTIVAIEESNRSFGSNTYVYIADVDERENIHEDPIGPNGEMIKYSEILMPHEVFIDNED